MPCNPGYESDDNEDYDEFDSPVESKSPQKSASVPKRLQKRDSVAFLDEMADTMIRFEDSFSFNGDAVDSDTDSDTYDGTPDEDNYFGEKARRNFFALFHRYALCYIVPRYYFYLYAYIMLFYCFK